jgi:hypothetical protein
VEPLFTFGNCKSFFYRGKNSYDSHKKITFCICIRWKVIQVRIFTSICNSVTFIYNSCHKKFELGKIKYNAGGHIFMFKAGQGPLRFTRRFRRKCFAAWLLFLLFRGTKLLLWQYNMDMISSLTYQINNVCGHMLTCCRFLKSDRAPSISFVKTWLWIEKRPFAIEKRKYARQSGTEKRTLNLISTTNSKITFINID